MTNNDGSIEQDYESDDNLPRMEVTPEQHQRIDDLFHEKLAAEDPNHPWVKRWQARKRNSNVT